MRIKIKVWWVILLIICQFRQHSCYNSLHYYLYDLWYYAWMLKYHYPGRFTTTMTTYINGTEERIPSTYDTPDFRIEEPHFVPYGYKYVETERPYLNSPAYKNYKYFGGRGYNSQSLLMYNMACFCCTVYRRLTVLAGCAVITSRHAITSATPTLFIIEAYNHLNTLDDIFGGWADTTVNAFNSSMYFHASRIHVHPEYTHVRDVNVSHPIPAMYDLAIIAAQVTFYFTFYGADTFVCNRAGSGRFDYTSTIPRWDDTSIVAGFQFIKSYNRNPVPWYRYIVLTNNHLWPCPKTEWQWFHCIMGEYWGRYGFDSGGGMGTAYSDRWRWNGLAGICSFSLKLRSKQTVHYFTVVDTYPVLDFLYDAFLGLTKCAWLDGRFEDTKWRAPLLYSGEWLKEQYGFGVQLYYSQWEIPFY